jgi:hypothetical protein
MPDSGDIPSIQGVGARGSTARKKKNLLLFTNFVIPHCGSNSVVFGYADPTLPVYSYALFILQVRFNATQSVRICKRSMLKQYY